MFAEHVVGGKAECGISTDGNRGAVDRRTKGSTKRAM